MLKECIEIFYRKYKKDGEEELITATYKLEEGDYFIVNKDGSYEHIKIEKNIDPSSIEKYDYLAQRDYLSRLLDMNKPIDDKKQIHSNNYLSFFIKNPTLQEKKNLLNEIIQKYYETLKNPLLKYNKGEKQKAYIKLENILGKPEEETIKKNYTWIQSNLYNLNEVSRNSKSYIKIFFDEDIEKYKRENKRYIIPNIYNNVEYNTLIDGKTYGLPNNNMNLNAKKIYLENKTRKKGFTAPYLLDEDEVFKQKLFFDYLQNLVNSGKRNIYITENEIYSFKDGEFPSTSINGYYLRLRKEKTESAIERFEVIPRYEYELFQKIVLDDSLDGGKNQKLEYGDSIVTKEKLIVLLNEFLFEGKLFRIVYENIKDIKFTNSKIKYISNLYKDVFYELIVKGEIEKFMRYYKQIFLELIKYSMSTEEYLTKAYDLYNFMTSINTSIDTNGNGGKIVGKHFDIKNRFRKIFEIGEGEIINDDEYFFAMGQLFKFLFSRRKDTKRTQEHMARVLDSRSIEALKTQLFHLYKKYGYDIQEYNVRFNILYEMVLDYTPISQKIDYERVLGGYLSLNLIYEKVEKENEDKNNQEE